MGRPKAMLPLGGTETFLARVVRTFFEAGVPDVVVVVGHEAAAISDSVTRHHPTVRTVFNAEYESGQLSSLLAGIRAVDRPRLEAILLTLVDVPLVAPATVRAVLDRYSATGAPVVRPVRGEEHGHPVLIDRSLFPALFAADPQQGAKPVIRAYVSAAGEVPLEDDGAFVDIDTPEEYERLTGRGSSSGR